MVVGSVVDVIKSHMLYHLSYRLAEHSTLAGNQSTQSARHSDGSFASVEARGSISGAALV